MKTSGDASVLAGFPQLALIFGGEIPKFSPRFEWNFEWRQAPLMDIACGKDPEQMQLFGQNDKV